MPTHSTGTRREWLAARLELLAAEKDLTRRTVSADPLNFFRHHDDYDGA